MLRVKARLVGTSCELEKGWVCLGVSGGGGLCNKGKGSRSVERRGKDGYFWNKRKESIGKANNG